MIHISALAAFVVVGVVFLVAVSAGYVAGRNDERRLYREQTLRRQQVQKDRNR